MKVEISIKTPTFIGSGTNVSDKEYEIKGEYVIIKKIKESFFDKVKGKKWLNWNLQQIYKMAEEQGELEYERIKSFCYSDRKLRINRAQIAHIVKEKEKAIIPGSTLKGAITSAIKYTLLQQRKDKKNNDCIKQYESLADNIIVGDFISDKYAEEAMGVYDLKNFNYVKNKFQTPIRAEGIIPGTTFNGEIKLYKHGDENDIRELFNIFNAENEESLISNIIKEVSSFQRKILEFYKTKVPWMDIPWNNNSILIGRYTTIPPKIVWSKNCFYIKGYKDKRSINVVMLKQKRIYPGIIEVKV